MKLVSTTDINVTSSWRDGVLRGLAPDGGLYIPERIPVMPEALRDSASVLPFPDLCFELSKLFLEGDVPPEVLRKICSEAFDFPVVLHRLEREISILELFHGPTCAFKDFGARFMARLFRHFLGQTGEQLTVLVATSGDTGSAVANAFFDPSPNAPIRVAVLFPRGKVSVVQEKQMTTLGGNVTAFEVDGTFDDCQRLVKQALGDESLWKRMRLTSANSINVARLLPQLFYYVYAAAHLGGPPPLFVVPSGNLGNITGGLLAHAMGMPAHRFVAACNANDVFPSYLTSGAFDPRPSVETLSNAMDVGNPSNFMRIAALFEGSYEKVRSLMTGYGITDEETLRVISEVYRREGYMLDPHTAVGYAAALEQRELEGTRPAIVLGTAHPAKFGDVVRRATNREPELPPQLAEVLERPGTKLPLPASYPELLAHLVGN